MPIADDGPSLTPSQQQYYDTVDAGIALGDNSAVGSIFSTLMDGVTAAEVAALTSGSGGQLVADLPALAALYNKLSAAQATLQTELTAMTAPLQQAAAPAAGGQVKGIATAWAAFANAAVAGDDSLLINLRTVNKWLQYFMYATLQSAQSYAGNDYTIVQSLQAAGAA